MQSAQEIAVSPPESLLKYEAPQFVGIEHRKGATATATANATAESNRLEDMVNAMLQPREWVEESGVWAQYVR